jgi:hypothetical protein
MINSSLQAFASKVQNAGRISFGDVKRLQRDILPDGITFRENAELLLTLEQSVSRADRTFSDWLAAEADHGGAVLRSPALNAASVDCTSAHVAVDPMPLAA